MIPPDSAVCVNWEAGSEVSYWNGTEWVSVDNGPVLPSLRIADLARAFRAECYRRFNHPATDGYLVLRNTAPLDFPYRIIALGELLTYTGVVERVNSSRPEMPTSTWPKADSCIPDAPPDPVRPTALEQKYADAVARRDYDLQPKPFRGFAICDVCKKKTTHFFCLRWCCYCDGCFYGVAKKQGYPDLDSLIEPEPIGQKHWDAQEDHRARSLRWQNRVMESLKSTI